MEALQACSPTFCKSFAWEANQAFTGKIELENVDIWSNFASGFVEAATPVSKTKSHQVGLCLGRSWAETVVSTSNRRCVIEQRWRVMERKRLGAIKKQKP